MSSHIALLTGVLRGRAHGIFRGWSCSDLHLWTRLDLGEKEFFKDLYTSHLEKMAKELSMVVECNCLLDNSIPKHEGPGIWYSRERLELKKKKSQKSKTRDLNLPTEHNTP